MSTVTKLWLSTFLLMSAVAVVAFFVSPRTEARNVQQYSDTISDSGPGYRANHTFDFLLTTNVSPGGRLEFTPPPGFTILATSTFDVRNVELIVNGTPRVAAATAAPEVDQ